jgi:methylated-DNA-protein-cysteine methyltransferase-like protein
MPRLNEEFFEAVYAVTRLIPRGQVATYGQIATYVVSPRYARAVGTALKNLDRAQAKVIPWQRVVNASGRISARGEVDRPTRQAQLLKKEGVHFDRNGKIDLRIFGWSGPGRGWKTPYADPKPGRVRQAVGSWAAGGKP